MVEGGCLTASFPVVFFDGEREMNIGDVRVHPALAYKPFQLMLSQKIGISPNQISIYLVNRKSNRRSPLAGDRRRIPITGKVNFGSVCRQKECCFLVILKRSRKSRCRRERMIGGGVEFTDFSPQNDFSPAPVNLAPENLILLRRSQTTPFYDQITLPELDGFNHVDPAVFGSNPSLDLDPAPRIGNYWYDNSQNERDDEAFCEECWNAKMNGGTTPFHPCVNDPVISRFTTRLGPINPPRSGGSFI